MSKISNFPSRDASQSASIMPQHNLQELIAGPSVVRSSFIVNIRAYGFRNTLKAFCGRYLYTLRLYTIRELAIMRTLVENYDKIPKNTQSRFFAGVFVRSVFLRRRLYNKEKKLLRKIITNPYQVKMTTNNS